MGNKRLCEKMEMKEEKREKGAESLKYKANVSMEPEFSEDKGDGVRIVIFT